ncbi:MAG: class I SAM-dependent methyltransferase [Planctomycetota bacterium]|nr:MAG: class I SAM-dependent methyltransferase [Planctomycetota bacterium]
MGLPKPALRFLIQEHKRRPFSGSVVTLGRQCVYATYDECVTMLRQEGITPQERIPPLERATNIPHWRGTPRERFTSDVAFFSLLGVDECLAMDYSDYEGATILADLNQPVAEELYERFDVIIDAGTLEHVFNIPCSLSNLARMLRPGGRVVHMNPANNYVNHGFYQISPTLYADYYRANRFDDLHVYVGDERLRGDVAGRIDLYELDPAHQPLLMYSHSRRRMVVYCVATKTHESTADAIPTQSAYDATYAEFAQQPLASDETAPRWWLSRLAWRVLPKAFYAWLRRQWIRFRARWIDPRRRYRPWGLRLARRLE